MRKTTKKQSSIILAIVSCLPMNTIRVQVATTTQKRSMISHVERIRASGSG